MTMKGNYDLVASFLWLLLALSDATAQSAILPALHGQPIFTPFRGQQLADSAEFKMITSFVGKKTIVAVGEVTHGTRQADQVQTKVAVDLCRNHGFNVVVLGEVYTASTLALNRYVLFDEGTLEEVLQPIADHQRVVTSETVALARWVHHENRTRPQNQRIWLVGAEVAPPTLLANVLLQQNQPRETMQPAAALYNLANTPMHLVKFNFGSDPALHITRTVEQAIQATPTEAAPFTPLEQQWERQVGSQYLHAVDIFLRDREALREVGIFENIGWLRTHLPNAKIVIIDAHNAHVERERCYDSDMAPKLAIKRFGHLIHDAYPNDYVVIGTEVQRGLFGRGKDGQTNQIPEHKRKIGTIVGKQTDSDYGFIDLRQCRAQGLFWGDDFRLTYGTSNQLVGSAVRCASVSTAFDALVFIRESQPSVLLDSLANGQRFAVYLNLGQPFTDSLIAARQVRVSVSGVRFSPDPGKRPDLKLQIYVHDKKQKFLKLVSSSLYISDSATTMLPPSAKFLSISIVGHNINQSQLSNIAINGRDIAPSEFLLIAREPYQLTVPLTGGFLLNRQ